MSRRIITREMTNLATEAIVQNFRLSRAKEEYQKAAKAGDKAKMDALKREIADINNDVKEMRRDFYAIIDQYYSR